MEQLRGIDFRFATSAGLPAAVMDESCIVQSFQQILATGRFERVMRPSSGSGIYAMLFENQGDLLRARLVEETKRALRANEKRVTVKDVRVVSYEGSTIVLDVVYIRLGAVSVARVQVGSAGGEA